MSRQPNWNLAKKTAAAVLQKHGIALPPILPRALAEAEGLTIRYAQFKPDFQEVCGFIEFAENRITVNADHPPNRQQFTIAHEFGHFLLHRQDYAENPQLYRILLRHPVKKDVDFREQEANAFAANLLVPKDLLKKYSRFTDSNEQLADLFGVSEEVIGYRRNAR